MITTTDIKDILYKDCKAFGMKVHRRTPKIKGERLKDEMIVIHSKSQTPEKFWKKSFAEINICIPDQNDEEHEIRIQEMERKAISLLGDVTGVFDGTRYRYGVESEGVEADTALKCHYVNIRLLFEVLNTI